MHVWDEKSLLLICLENMNSFFLYFFFVFGFQITCRLLKLTKRSLRSVFILAFSHNTRGWSPGDDLVNIHRSNNPTRKMTRKEHKAAGNPIPSTFRMALTEMVLVTISPLLILFLVWYFIWLDEYRNDIFLNGLGPIRGWSCGETYPSAGYYLFISLVVASLCLYIPSLMFLVLDGYLEQRGIVLGNKCMYISLELT